MKTTVCVILDQENLRNFMRNSIIEKLPYIYVGSHFLLVHVNSTFHRKVKLNHAEVEGGGAHMYTYFSK